MYHIGKGYLILLSVCLVILNSCQWLPRTNNEELVATAHGNNLYVSDLHNVVPENTSPSDSISIINRYVDNWVRQQVFLEHAKNNLNPEQMDFNKKIENYKNSLIVFTYENKLLREKLDTTINKSEIAEYYEAHKDEFKLKDNIVRVTYVKIPGNAPNQDLLRRLYRSTEPEQLEQLEEYCIQNAATYFIDTESWLVFDEVIREIPIQASNQTTFLRNNRFSEISDEYYRYFIYIHDYKLKGSIAPLSFAENNIKNIILNRRKQVYINNLRNELYRNAIKSNQFEVFI